MYIKEIGWEDVDWIHLEHDRTKWRAVVNTVMFLTTNHYLLEKDSAARSLGAFVCTVAEA
jgi:hypothetical protein